MHELRVKTERRTQLVEITRDVDDALEGVDGASAALVFVPHTTAGLTINEFEPLLMRHDLAAVVRNPLEFLRVEGRDLVRDPWAIPQKTIAYARYDMIRVFNELVDVFRLGQSRLERLMARLFAVPARRFLRVKRSVSLLVSDHDLPGYGAVAGGRYQSPILLQWRGAPAGRRRVDLTLTRLR